MKLHFLGGANEVGASCTLVEIEGRRLLVDAGIRMGVPAGSQLPNLAVMDEVGFPEEVLVTHAHTDHTGALPVVAPALPSEVPIRCTLPTLAITRVLLNDALKIMDLRGDKDGELPLYPPEAVENVLSRVRQAAALTTVPICEGALKATWIPSGHILGAAAIYIEGARESLLMTGDVSVANQRTIPGMVVPQCRPSVIVMESTYGNRQHADRNQQEAALVARVNGVIQAGGKVLIPAFAVGRAQEVILILSRAMRRGEIPTFPVHIDGMVRAVNGVYGAFPDDLAPPVRRRVQKGEDPFYTDSITAVAVPDDRERILEGPPCCIIASSGMLIGGASSYYAERLAGDPDNLIAITGYQDEESPGRALLDLAKATEPEDRTLRLNGKKVAVACRVEPYSLSAHADAGELGAIVRRLAPEAVYLVHGDDDARAALSRTMDLHLSRGVHLPDNGASYSHEPATGSRARRYGRLHDVNGISGARPFSAESLPEVKAYLEDTGIGGPFRVQELAEIWYGTRGLDEEALETVSQALQESAAHFSSDTRRPFLYHFSQAAGESDPSAPMEVNQARELIQAAFPESAGLYRCSVFEAEDTFELAFHFPDTARERHADIITSLQDRTRWQIRLRETPHQERLADAALGALPPGATPVKRPAIRMDQREVEIQVALDSGLEEMWEEESARASDSFTGETGFALTLRRQGETPVEATPASAPEAAWEINRAYNEIRETFAGEKHAPMKAGLKPSEGCIEVAFISPQVGARYREQLDGLEARIGWPIRIRDSANQIEIAREARRITPETCRLRGEPRLHLSDTRVVVPVVEMPPGDARDSLREVFLESTGFQIEWEEPRVG
jgi:uncharacterized protein